VTWSRGEAAHASLHTFAPPPRPLGVSTPSETQREVWRTSDHLALGTPHFSGTIITYSEHTVGGRNARTGAQTWSYTRTDRTVCTTAQMTDTASARGYTVAVYEHKGNCDQLSAFDSGTGRRLWTRTLDMDAMPLDGHPMYQVTSDTLLLASPSVIYAIYPYSGVNRCIGVQHIRRVWDVVLGDAGALISQDCSAQVNCSNEKFCARGPQLTLRNGIDGVDDDAEDQNHDKIIWNLRGNTDIPVSADNGLVSAVDPGGTSLHAYAPGNGKETGSLALAPATSELGPVTAISTGGGELVWLAGQLYAFGTDVTQPLWQSASIAPPTVRSTTRETTPPLDTARITVPVDGGVGILNGSDGQLAQQFAVGTTGADSLVYSLGTGFLVAGPAGVVTYQ